MRGNKTAVWRNGTGQEIVFDNRTFFLEDIDMTGTSGIHTVESLARADGQVSIAHQLAAKTIPCSFAWYDSTQEDDYMREKLTQLFNPLMSGTLTVYTRENVYAIDCYPQDFPVFKRVSGLPVWRWSVDFVADYPYWRKGAERVFHLTHSVGNSLFSPCPFAIAPVIELKLFGTNPELLVNGNTVMLGISNSERGTSGGLTIDPDFSTRTLVIDTNTLTIKDKRTGADCSYLIDANEDIEALRITRGYNTVVCHEQGGQVIAWQNTVLRYHELSMGEV